jgi:hypothetical protein
MYNDNYNEKEWEEIFNYCKNTRDGSLYQNWIANNPEPTKERFDRGIISRLSSYKSPEEIRNSSNPLYNKGLNRETLNNEILKWKIAFCKYARAEITRVKHNFKRPSKRRSEKRSKRKNKGRSKRRSEKRSKRKTRTLSRRRSRK